MQTTRKHTKYISRNAENWRARDRERKINLKVTYIRNVVHSAQYLQLLNDKKNRGKNAHTLS